MSVGAVCWPDYMKTRTTTRKEFLLSTLMQAPELAERMQNATLIGEVTASANYSYTSTRMHGEGYLLLGDAFAFVDPVFSTGVYFAMKSAVLGVELVDASLRNESMLEQTANSFETDIKLGIKYFSWFIYRFNAYSMRHLLMHNPGKNASKYFKMSKAAVISVFSGDIFKQPTLVAPILIFKINYYLISIAKVMHNFNFLKRRLNNLSSKKDP
jgi:flavin-dependent dehydrogenase